MPKIFLHVKEYYCSFNEHYLDEISSDIKLREMSERDLVQLNLVEKELSIRKTELLIQRIKSSVAQVYMVIEKNDIVGWVCLSTYPEYESGIRKNVHLGQKEIYFFDDYIFERFRGKGIHKMTIQSRIGLAVEKGFHIGKVIIYANHYASEKNYLVNGFKKKADLYSFRPLRIIMKKEDKKWQFY